MAQALALTSLLALLYTIVGYPVVIAILARLRPLRTTIDPAYEPPVTACVPVHNEASVLGAKLQSLLAQDYPPDKLEILVYSDGSTDESDAVVQNFAMREPRVKLMRSEDRQGKPTGIARMKATATGEVLLMTDARQPLEPGALRSLVAMLSDPNVGTVSGNLVLRGKTGPGLYWRYENWLRDKEARFRSMLGVTGPIYVIRKADMPEIPRDVILDDMWIPLRLRLRGRRLLFAKEAIAYDQAFENERELRRKVRTLAGNYQLFARLPQLLVPGLNPSWFEMFSHKVLRLLLPWFLLVLLVASVSGGFLTTPGERTPRVFAMQALLLGQALFYLAALVGSRCGKAGNLARTFVVLSVASVIGLLRYLGGMQQITWKK